jgi:hypothetical protein
VQSPFLPFLTDNDDLDRMTNCTAYWDLAFGTAKDVAIPHE